MANIVEYAKKELDILGMKEEEGINGSMRKHLLKMVEVFSEEGHSGFSAAYAIGVLEKLLRYEPLTPLTGADDEWVEIAEHESIGGKLWQNQRCYHVFKDEQGVYDAEGRIFYEWVEDKETGEKQKSFFTSKDSRTPITFPYIPERQYVEYVKEEQENDG